MANGDFRQSLYDTYESQYDQQYGLDVDLGADQEEIRAAVKTSGYGALDFLGQFLWGGAEAVSLETFGVADTFSKALADDPDQVDTWEASIAESVGGVEGDWDQLTGWGRAGYIGGQAIGSIPSFFYGGLFAKGVTKGGSAVLGKALKTSPLARHGGYGNSVKFGVRKSAKEVSEAFGEKTIKESLDKAGAKIDDTVARNIADDSYDIFAENSLRFNLEAGFQREAFEEIVTGKLSQNLGDILKISDENILKPLSKEVYNIATRNHPIDAQKQLYLVSSHLTDMIPGLKQLTGGMAPKVLGHKTNSLISAAAYDALIGVGMGILKGATHSMQQSYYGVKRDDYGEYVYEGDYSVDRWDVMESMWHHAMTDAYHFAFIGPAKFVRGGTGLSHSKQLRTILSGHTQKYWKRPSSYSKKEIRQHLDALNTISDKKLSKAFKKWDDRGSEWWLKESASLKEMQGFLKEIRTSFTRDAYLGWAKEFGVDVFHSLPRMAAGVMAMNAPSIIQRGNEMGWNWENLKGSLGETAPEIAANVWTAMWFTRKPHSFHAPVNSKVFNRIFESGNIKQYKSGNALMGLVNFKARQFEKTMAAVKTISAKDAKQLEGITAAWNMGSPRKTFNQRLTHEEFDTTFEFNEIKSSIENSGAHKNQTGVPMRVAYNKAIAEKVKSGEITESSAREFLNKGFVAEEIMDLYKNYSGKYSQDLLFTPEAAFDFVSRVSNIEFGGKKVILGDTQALNLWKDKTVAEAALRPQKIQQDYIQDVYRILELNYEPMDQATGKITGPKIIVDSNSFPKLGQDIKLSLIDVQDMAVKNNWLVQGKGGKIDVTPEQASKIHQSFLDHSAKLMELTYGKEWAKNPLVDGDFGEIGGEHVNIMSNKTWALAYDRAVRLKQQFDGYELITNGKEHNYDPVMAEDFNTRMRDWILYEKAPEIDKKAEADPNFGVYQSYLKNLHEVARLTNPEAVTKNKKAPTLSLREAKELYDASVSLTGDLFVESQNIVNFKTYAVERAIDKLGLDNINLKLDYKASAAELILDPKFNKGELGKIEIPQYDIISKEITALRANRQISKEYAKELLEFYDTFTQKIEKSNFPLEFKSEADGMVELTKGDFVGSLRKAHTIGKIRMDSFLGDSQWLVHKSLAREQDRIESLIESIKHGTLDPDKKVLVKNDNLIKELVVSRDQVRDLKRLVKNAVEERDPYMLRALEKYSEDIRTSMVALEMQDVNDASIKLYTQALNLIQKKVEQNRQSRAFTESSLKHEIAAEIEKFSRDVTEKDVQDVAIKLSTNQFKAKYKFSNRGLEQLFELDKSNRIEAKEIKGWVQEVLKDMYLDDSAEMSAWKSQNRAWVREFETLENSLKSLPKYVDLDVTTPEGVNNFNKLVREPLVLAMKKAVKEMPASERPRNSVIFEDAHSIAQAHFSKTVVKGLKMELKSNKMIMVDKTVGLAKNRGFTGILEYLDPNQQNIFLLEKSGTGTDGKVIRDITGKDLPMLNNALSKGNMEIVHEKGKAEAYRNNNTTLIQNQNTKLGSLQDRKYMAVPLNESTNLIIRVDKAGGLAESIALNFRPESGVTQGGQLYKMLKAVYDGDLNKNTPEHRAAYELVKRLANKDLMTPNDQMEAIKLTRALLNHPGYIKQILSGEGVNLDADVIKKVAKYDKMNEPKSGIIPTVENRIKSGIMYSKSESPLHQKAWNRDILDRNGNVIGKMSDWFDPKKKKGMKIASVNDEGDIIVNGRKVDNIFSATDRAKHDFKKELDAKRDLYNKKQITNKELEIYEKEYKINMEAAENVGKSIVDGEMYNTFEAQLAMMMHYGLNPDMVRVHEVTGDIIGFKSGGIKPTISWANVETGQKNYGRIQQYYVKTAMKYDPRVEALLKQWGVDALVFKSSNKINTLKEGVNKEQRELYLEPQETDPGAFSGGASWLDHISLMRKVKTIDGKDMQQGGRNAGESFVNVPFEAFNIRTVSREHDPMVGQNAGVHMSHDIGIREWIGVDLKLDNFKDMYHKVHGDVIERTAIAQKVLGSNAKTGDPSQINSVMSNVLLRNGLILEPHLLRKLERDLISYNMNNGAISGGIVPDGSLDVMSADFGTLKPTVRSRVGDRDVVRLFGEFTPSYYASQKPFKRYGDVSNGSSSEVQNVIIQRRRYKAEDGVIREADMFVIELAGGEKFVQVEGRMIDSKGRIIDIDAYTGGQKLRSIIEVKGGEKINKAVYDKAVGKDKEMFDLKDANGDYFLSNKYKLSEVAEMLDNIKIKDTGISYALGTLNVRQPRNMMGDVVISKIAKDVTTGDWHTDKNSGNLSRMNYLDAITPQDADFDFDKSFNYTAAPGRYWTQTNKVAGFVTTQSMDKINDIFNPYGKEGFISHKLSDLLGTNISEDIIRNEANLARGQFIKMHQTSTYLANVYRHDGVVAEQNIGNQIFQVRLNTKGKYHSTVNNISEAAKLFIDMYKNPPSKEQSEFANIKRYQNEIWFGENGIFELTWVNKNNPTDIKPVDFSSYSGGLNNPKFANVQSTIRNLVIDPINRYLKFNQGLMEDPSGITSKASLKAYHDAYSNILNLAVNGSYGSKYAVDKNVDMSSSFNHIARYFAESSAPYDVAMKGLYQTYYSSNEFRKAGNIGRSQSEYELINDYIMNNFSKADPALDRKVYKSKIIDKALTEYVRSEADALKAISLKKTIQQLEIELQDSKNFYRGDPTTNAKANQIQGKLNRAREILAIVEESLAYKYAPKDIKENKIKGSFKPDTWTNTSNTHRVIIDASGNIKEVILAGQKNTKYLNKGDKQIENGRYFKITDPQEQLGMEILHNAFANPPIIIDKNGNHREMHYSSIKESVSQDIRKINAEIASLEKMPKQTKREKDNYYLEVERILNKHLFEIGDAAEVETYRKALIYGLLTPGVSQKMISYTSIGLHRGEKGYYYFENKNSEATMSLLTKILNGDRVGDKGFAEVMLRDIEMNKRIGYAMKKNPNLDYKLTKDAMYTADLGQTSIDLTNNPIIKDVILSPRIFEQLEATNANTRNAAKLMLDFAQGKGQIDPVRLYRASKVMEKAGISINEQFGRMENLTLSDGTLKRFGATKLRFTEFDKLTRKNLGEHGGSKISTSEWVKQMLDCYKD